MSGFVELMDMWAGDGTAAREMAPEVRTCRMVGLPDEPCTSIRPMRCTACGFKTYAQLANFCPHCGRSVLGVGR